MIRPEVEYEVEQLEHHPHGIPVTTTRNIISDIETEVGFDLNDEERRFVTRWYQQVGAGSVRHTEYYILDALIDGSLTKPEVEAHCMEMLNQQRNGCKNFDKFFEKLVLAKYVQDISDGEYELTAKGVRAHYRGKMCGPTPTRIGQYLAKAYRDDQHPESGR